jgi:hypothetical protein
MSCLIKDEKAFRASIQTDDRLWAAVEELIERNAHAFDRDMRTIFDHPAVILPHASGESCTPEHFPAYTPRKVW